MVLYAKKWAKGYSQILDIHKCIFVENTLFFMSFHPWVHYFYLKLHMWCFFFEEKKNNKWLIILCSSLWMPTESTDTLKYNFSVAFSMIGMFSSHAVSNLSIFFCAEITPTVIR